MEFSPDGHFLIVRSEDPEGPDLAWNVREKNIVKLTGPLKPLNQSWLRLSSRRIRIFISQGENALTPGVANCTSHSVPLRAATVRAESSFWSFLLEPPIPVFVVVRHFGSSLPRRSSPNRSAAVELSDRPGHYQRNSRAGCLQSLFMSPSAKKARLDYMKSAKASRPVACFEPDPSGLSAQ